MHSNQRRNHRLNNNTRLDNVCSEACPIIIMTQRNLTVDITLAVELTAQWNHIWKSYGLSSFFTFNFNFCPSNTILTTWKSNYIVCTVTKAPCLYIFTKQTEKPLYYTLYKLNMSNFQQTFKEKHEIFTTMKHVIQIWNERKYYISKK